MNARVPPPPPPPLIQCCLEPHENCWFLQQKLAKQLLIEGGEGAFFLCLEKMVVRRKS